MIIASKLIAQGQGLAAALRIEDADQRAGLIPCAVGVAKGG